MKLNLKALKSNIFQLILFAIACLLLVSFIAFLMSNGKSFDIGKLGSLGDFFGGVLNPIFAFLAFLALLTTIILQASELKATRKELRKSAKAQKKQSKSLKLQNFENTFFNLINLHNDLTLKFREFKIIENSEKFYMYGDEAISFFLDKFNESCTDSEGKKEDRHLDIDSLKINFKIKKGRKSFKFIKTVFTILNLMESYKNIKNNENEINYYLDILYAQISEEELILIFYYGLLYKSYFKELLEEYGFFEDLNADKLLNKKELLLYNISAYGNNELIKNTYYQNKS